MNIKKIVFVNRDDREELCGSVRMDDVTETLLPCRRRTQFGGENGRRIHGNGRKNCTLQVNISIRSLLI